MKRRRNRNQLIFFKKQRFFMVDRATWVRITGEKKKEDQTWYLKFYYVDTATF